MSPMKFGDTFVSFELVILKNGISQSDFNLLFICLFRTLS